MKILTRVTCVIILVSFISSCGVITRARYGNGLKLNVELGVFQKRDQVVQGKKEKPKPVHATQKHSLDKKPVVLQFPDFEKVPMEQTHQQGTLESTPIASSLSGSGAGENRNIHKAIQLAKQKINPVKPIQVNYDDRPLEPNIRVAGWLFYGGLIMSAIPLPYIGTIAGLMVLIGYILAMVGLSKIKQSGYGYKGRGLGLSIVILYSAMMILAILFLLLFIAAFAI